MGFVSSLSGRCAVGLVASLALLVSGCSADPTSEQPTAHAGTLSPALAAPEVDSSTGVIVLPVDRFMLSDAETAQLLSAQSLAVAKCASREGVDLTWKPVDFKMGASRTYGVWYRPEAERYGYGLPSATPSPDGQESRPLTDADLAVLDRCNSSKEVRALAFDQIRPAFDYAEAFTGVSAAARESDEGKQAFADWEHCLNDAGLQRDPAVSPFAIKGTDTSPTESNIKIALIDVGCKQETHFVERLARAEAALEVPIIESHLAELEQLRSEYDAALERAKAYLVENAP